MNQSANNTEFEETEEVSLGDLFYKFVPYWPFFVILVVLLFMTGAWIYLRYKMPVYQTTATLLIKDDKNSTPASELQDAFDMFGAKKECGKRSGSVAVENTDERGCRKLTSLCPGFYFRKGYSSVSLRVVADSCGRKISRFFKSSKGSSLLFNKQVGTVVIQGTAYPLNQWENTPYGILRFLPNPYYHPSNDPEKKSQAITTFH